MAKVKLSKTELKRQRDDLKRYTRFLPTLQLKKQQLQMELRQTQEAVRRHQQEAADYQQQLDEWIGLFARDDAADLTDLVHIGEVKLGERNIAGVDVPEFGDVIFDVDNLDLFATDPWYDDAVEAIQQRIKLHIQGLVLAKQAELLQQELRTTTQRVNLFEKVKIPECKENIRTIQIYLGDQQTAAVGRAKIAKNKLTATQGEPGA